VRFDLNVHADALKAFDIKQIDNKRATKFVSEKLFKDKHASDLELFKHCC